MPGNQDITSPQILSLPSKSWNLGRVGVAFGSFISATLFLAAAGLSPIGAIGALLAVGGAFAGDHMLKKKQEETLIQEGYKAPSVEEQKTASEKDTFGKAAGLLKKIGIGLALVVVAAAFFAGTAGTGLLAFGGVAALLAVVAQTAETLHEYNEKAKTLPKPEKTPEPEPELSNGTVLAKPGRIKEEKQSTPIVSHTQREEDRRKKEEENLDTARGQDRFSE